MKISESGIELIKKFEGFRPKPYLDSAKIPTVGYGTTYYPTGKNVTLSDPEITREQAVTYLKSYLDDISETVTALLPAGINQRQFDAVMSFCYNLGVSKFKSSTLLKKIKANHYDTSIYQEFMKWIYAGGQQLDGLKKRREAEATLYFTI